MDISVIICTHNRANILQDTLESLAQVRPVTGLKSEVIIIDNGSTDSTRTVVTAHPTFYFYVESRKGLSRARNLGVRKSSGSILLFTDDDVRVMPDWMETLSRPILAGQADGVTGQVRLATHLDRPWMTPMHRGFLASQELDCANPYQMVGANMGIARRVFEKIPSFDDELGAGTLLGTAEEMLYSWQMQEAGFKIIGIKEALVWHHFEPDRLMRSKWLNAAKTNGRAIAYIDHHWRHKSIPAAYYQYNRAVARYAFWRILRWRECATIEGIAEWEFSLLKYMYRLQHHLVERKRSRNYALRGLVKL